MKKQITHGALCFTACLTMTFQIDNGIAQNFTTSFGGGNQLNLPGFGNTVYGASAFITSTGGRNCVFGFNSMPGVSQAFGSCAFGEATLTNNFGGIKNSAFGNGAGVAGPNMSNATAIGAGAVVTANNAIQLGDQSVTDVFAGVGSTAKLTTGALRILGGNISQGNILVSDALGNANWQPANSVGWSLQGNSGTNPNSDYIGTNDQTSLNFKIYGIPAGRLDPAGNVNFGIYSVNTNPFSANTGNVSIGFYALSSAISANFNTAVGYSALSLNTTGHKNVAIGGGTLWQSTGSTENTAVGWTALSLFNNGNWVTGIGAYAEASSSGFTNAGVFGANAIVNSSNKIRIGDVITSIVEAQTFVSTVSDERFKTNISNRDVVGLDFIMKLNPVVYNFDGKKFTEFLVKNMHDTIKQHYLAQDFTKSTSLRQTGFLAQEVEKAAKEVGYQFNGVHVPETSDDNYSIAYASFVVPLVKAVQEQQKQIEALQNKLTASTENEKSALLSGLQNQIKAGYVLAQNIPNPFSKESTINYAIPNQFTSATLQVCDLSGKQIQKHTLSANEGTIHILGNELGAGIFLYSLVVDGEIISTKRMVITD